MSDNLNERMMMDNVYIFTIQDLSLGLGCYAVALITAYDLGWAYAVLEYWLNME